MRERTGERAKEERIKLSHGYENPAIEHSNVLDRAFSFVYAVAARKNKHKLPMVPAERAQT